MSDAIASALASDVEYRIHQVVDVSETHLHSLQWFTFLLQEAARFTRHARRTMMTTSDIDQALRVMNIEPLYGHSPYNPPTFKRALPYPTSQAAGTVYFVEDEEIDFDRVLREEKIPLPKPANWTAHWLAVEGVQPLIPENPPAIPREEADLASAKLTTPARAGPQLPPTPPSPGRSGSYGSKKPNQLLVKQVLSRELQLYYTRLTSTLLPPRDDAMRTAALTSLRSDAGLQTLLPYLVKWVGDGVIGVLRETGTPNEMDGKILEIFLDAIGALLDNKTLFVEPYVSARVIPRRTFEITLHAASSTAPSLIINTPFWKSSSIKCNAFTHGGVTSLVAFTDAALNDVSIALPSNYEDSACCSDIAREEQRYKRRRGQRFDWSRQGSSPERIT